MQVTDSNGLRPGGPEEITPVGLSGVIEDPWNTESPHPHPGSEPALSLTEMRAC